MATRSIKAELYKFIKAVIMGGTHTDAMPKTRTFTGISEIKSFKFYNSQLQNDVSNNYALPAVLVSFRSIAENRQQRRTVQYNVKSTTTDLVEIELHLHFNKMHYVNDEIYLDCFDLAAKIEDALSDKRFLGCNPIRKIGEEFDDNSQVVLDYVIRFEAEVINEGYGDTEEEESVEIDIDIQPPLEE